MGWLYIVFVFNALVPTKRFPVFGIPAGDFVTLAIYVLFAFKAVLLDRDTYFRGPLNRVWVVCLAVVVLSASRSFLTLENHTYWMWNAKQVIHYLFLFPLVSVVRSWEQYRRCVKGYLVIGVLGAALLHVYEQFPYLVDHSVGSGMLHGEVAGMPRVFTPGMQYVFLCSVALLPFLHWKIARLAAWLFLLSGLVWTFGRAYFGILSICAGCHLAILAGCRKISKLWAGAGILLALAVAAGGSQFVGVDARSALVERMATLSEARGASSITEFDTLGWRFRDAASAIDQVETPAEILFGVFAKLYVTEGSISTSVHLGYVGVYYHYGLLGVFTFGLLIVMISAKALWLLRKAMGGSPSLELEWVASLCLSWVAMCLMSVIGGTFASGAYIIQVMLISHGMGLLEKAAQPSSPPGVFWLRAHRI